MSTVGRSARRHLMGAFGQRRDRSGACCMQPGSDQLVPAWADTAFWTLLPIWESQTLRVKKRTAYKHQISRSTQREDTRGGGGSFYWEAVDSEWLRCLSVESRRQGEGLELGHTVQVQHRTLGKVKVVWRDLNAHKMTTLLEKVSGGGKRPNTISNTSWQPFRPVLTSSFLL